MPPHSSKPLEPPLRAGSDDDCAITTASALIGEIYSIYGSLRTLIISSNASLRLAPLEILTLGAVAEQPKARTVAEIGRMTGYSRQAIQRAANALERDGLIELVANPRHKRAPLLVATSAGTAMKRQTEEARGLLAELMARESDAATLSRLLDDLRGLRSNIEEQSRSILTSLRSRNPKP